MSALTAIVGPNGSGKTSVLRAIGLVLGEFWPSLRSVRVPQDFTRFDTSLDLVTEVSFDPALTHEDSMGKTHAIPTLRYTCKPYKKKTKKADAGDLHADLDPIGEKGDVPVVPTGWKSDRKPDFSRLRVTNDLRDQARVLLVDHRRSVIQHLPSTKGSALGRLFDVARKELDAAEGDEPSPRARFSQAYKVAMDALRTSRVQEVERTIEETAKRMAGFMGQSALDEVEIGFGFADPANPLNSMRLVYKEGGLEIPAEELGLGIQSALVVGIFDALRRLGGRVGTLVIEEPEMYLHPQAQRYFYRLLREMADSAECQLIYSTHSPIFADITRFESVRLIRKEPGSMTSVSQVTGDASITYLQKQRDTQKLVAAFDASRSEILFARRALLVEGHGDRLAALDAAERMGYDLDAEDLAIVMCGSKSAIPFFARVCSALSIPFLVLHDEDIYPAEGGGEQQARVERENEYASTANDEIMAAAVEEGRVFVLQPSLEGALNISRNARDKPSRVVEAMKNRSPNEFPDELRKAIEALFAE